MDLLTEARKLGERLAWGHNHEMDTGVVGTRQATEARDAVERLADIAGVIGEAAREAFAEGYDATIDFSLNSDWRGP